MNDYLISVLLGIIEGLTEFLPISSTAHLRIAEALLHLDLHDSFWKMYTIVIQLGAILALPVYFRERDREISFHLSARGTRGPHCSHPSLEPDAHRVCHHRHPIVAAEKADRPESGEPDRDGVGHSHRRRDHVDRGCDFHAGRERRTWKK